MLQKGQIRELLIWVHPGHPEVSQGVLDAWREVIDILQYEPRVALIETSMMSDPEYEERQQEEMKAYFYGVRLPKETYLNSRISYGEFARTNTELNGLNIDHMHLVGDLEALAAEKLGERYLLWPHGNFINGNDDAHADFLQRRFNLAAQSNSTVDLPDRTYFFFIGCYGLIPDICVQWQLHDFHISRYCLFQEQDLGIAPQAKIYNSRTLMPRNSIIGKPSTKESLALMAQLGYLDRPTQDQLQSWRNGLPSASSPEALQDIVNSFEKVNCR